MSLVHGVPQGSCIGPIAFLAYTSELADITQDYNISVMSYADDIQLSVSCKPLPHIVQNTIDNINNCISDIRRFLLSHTLKINDNKTVFMSIGTKQQLSKINLNETYITVGNSIIKNSEHTINLGFTFDANMNLNKQINNVCKKSYYQIVKIGQIKNYITKKNT